MDENLATLLEVVADEAGSTPAVLHGELVRGWADFADRSARLARHLADHGIERGSRVGVALYNGPEYLEVLFAAMKLRAVPVNVNYRYRETELRELFHDSGMAGLVFDSGLAGRIAAVGTELLVRVEIGGDYERVMTTTEPMPRIERSGDDEWLMFTGGTTGRPKGVLARHRGLLGIADTNSYALLGKPFPTDLDALAVSTRELLEGPDRLVTVIAPPLMHATGLYTALSTLLCAGTVVFLPSRSFDAGEMARTVERHRATDLCIVGDVFARPFADALDGGDYDVRSLRRMLSVGVVWSADVKERILRHCDARLRDVLAASEGGPFAIAVTQRGEHQPTSHFELAPGARVIDDEGHDVEPGSGQTGYLAAPVSDDVSYLDDPEKTAQTFRTLGGTRYAVPGDLVRVQSDGSLVLLGRGNRVINTGGEKVFAEEVERVVGEHPAVADVNVVGLPDERWGERIAAVVAVRPGAELTADELGEHVGAYLAGYKRPRDIVFVPEVRRRPTGKSDLAWARTVALRATQRKEGQAWQPPSPSESTA
ncbi:MAG: AMP-binding protein [Pseudonocardiaceae bacterium]|nr:AMP-binding protein [Pseudonocardiaceae bacterium]